MLGQLASEQCLEAKLDRLKAVWISVHLLRPITAGRFVKPIDWAERVDIEFNFVAKASGQQLRSDA